MTSPRVFLIDTNILIDVATDSPFWGVWSVQALSDAQDAGRACINAVIFGEVSAAYPDLESAESALAELHVERLEFPYPAAFMAAKAHLAYRRAGGTRQSTLSDFLIGAHALFLGAALVTRDPRPHRTYYPDLHLIAPTLS